MKSSTLPWPRASASASTASSALAGPDNQRHDSARNPTPSQPERPTQPVLVRAYSGNVDTTMSSRRFFQFSNSRSTSTPIATNPQPEIPLPSDKDFSIESILQAIEPDIRGTLDSIAEICGRSKLSLANEYGSHIAPLGEITATPGLMPVEETHEQEHERVEIEDDIDTAPDMHPFSFHRYLENLRHTASMLEGSSHRPASPRSPGMNSDAETVFAIGPDPVSSTPLVREFASRPNHTGSQLLAKNAATRDSNMVTAAVVSEVHLDASADEGETDHLPKPALMVDGPAVVQNGPEVVQQLLGWLNFTARVAGPDSAPSLQSAEERLRATLRADTRDPSLAAT
ncbi:unnamed protein product [Penicillium salamii]|nr:unnamed protein product [Penicillium salamii]CAG8316105.1 unnamed protein product [Penicillium salamii]CAG8361671.1 unnamed protein product [Penicillium salamii]